MELCRGHYLAYHEEVTRKIFLKQHFECELYEKVKVEVTQSYLTLFDPMDCSSPDSSIHGNTRQEHWSRLPFSSPGDLPNLGTETRSFALWVDSLPSDLPGKFHELCIAVLCLLR